MNHRALIVLDVQNDAVRAGFEPRVLPGLSVGVSAATTRTALEELRAAGAALVGTPAAPNLD